MEKNKIEIWKMWFKGMDLVIYKMSSIAKLSKNKMVNKMPRKSIRIPRRFILDNVTPPIKYEGYEMYPAGYTSFPTYWCYKKLININEIISIFLKRRREIKNDDKVLKCLELIESLIDDCPVMKLGTNCEDTFDEAFPDIVKFIEKVGYEYKDNYHKLYDVGTKIYFDDNESDKVKEKYIIIVHKLYKKEIWSFNG